LAVAVEAAALLLGGGARRQACGSHVLGPGKLVELDANHAAPVGRRHEASAFAVGGAGGP